MVRVATANRRFFAISAFHYTTKVRKGRRKSAKETRFPYATGENPLTNRPGAPGRTPSCAILHMLPRTVLRFPKGQFPDSAGTSVEAVPTTCPVLVPAKTIAKAGSLGYPHHCRHYPRPAL